LEKSGPEKVDTNAIVAELGCPDGALPGNSDTEYGASSSFRAVCQAARGRFEDESLIAAFYSAFLTSTDAFNVET
jgi:hypothetical protein